MPCLAVYKNLSRLPSLQDNEDFRALGTLIEGLEKLSEMELLPPSDQRRCLRSNSPRLLDELRVLIEPILSRRRALRSYLALARRSSAGYRRSLRIAAGFPQSCSKQPARNGIDRSRNNSQSAVRCEPDAVVIRFEDTGSGNFVTLPDYSSPFSRERMRQVWVLYVSRAILRGFGGELRFEPRADGLLLCGEFS